MAGVVDARLLWEAMHEPGCISQGRTRSQAVENIREAILAYLESLEAHGEPVPPSIEKEVVEVAV
ncbi:MAG: type II toxin-antitoxin system HicB family antitoxin [Thermoleophilia bacterium]